MFLILVSIPVAAHAYMFGRWLIKNGNRTGGLVVHLIAATCVALPVYRYMSAS
jgi:hypothetical protein